MEPKLSLDETKAIVETKTAPRVTEASIKDRIERSLYLYDDMLTICVLTMSNGFKVVGTSACASPENYVKEVGDRVAFNDALRQLWAFEGYRLRERLAFGEAY